MDFDGASRPTTSTVAHHPCSVCGRTFNPDSLARHESICAKNASKKRKVFDSSKMRIRGTDIEQRELLAPRRKTEEPAKPIKPKKADWRRQHEDFIAAIRSARGVTAALKTGGPLPPPPPPAENPDYVKCEYCQRRFQEQTAERHIPFCREKAQRLGGAKVSQAAKDKLQKRNSYKPPLPGTRQRSGVASDRGSTQSHPAASGMSQQTGGVGAHRRTSSQRPADSRYTDSQTQMDGGYSQVPPSRGRAPQPSAPKRTTAVAARGRQPSSSGVPTSQVRQGGQPSYGRQPANKNRTFTLHSDSSGDPANPGGNDRVEMETPQQLPRGSSASSRRRIEAARAHSQSSYEAVNSPSTSGFSDMSSSSERSLPPIQNGHFDPDRYRGSGPSPPIRSGQPPRHDYHQTSASSTGRSRPAGTSKFCYECGSQFPVPHAKFCCECGTRRA